MCKSGKVLSPAGKRDLAAVATSNQLPCIAALLPSFPCSSFGLWLREEEKEEGSFGSSLEAGKERIIWERGGGRRRRKNFFSAKKRKGDSKKAGSVLGSSSLSPPDILRRCGQKKGTKEKKEFRKRSKDRLLVVLLLSIRCSFREVVKRKSLFVAHFSEGQSGSRGSF